MKGKTTPLHTSVASCCHGRKNNQTLRRYLLLLNLQCRHFEYAYLLGRPFVIQTDHQTLTWLDCLKEDNPRLTRWSLSLQLHQFTMDYHAGKANTNADALLYLLTRVTVSRWRRGEECKSCCISGELLFNSCAIYDTLVFPRIIGGIVAYYLLLIEGGNMLKQLLPWLAVVPGAHLNPVSTNTLALLIRSAVLSHVFEQSWPVFLLSYSSLDVWTLVHCGPRADDTTPWGGEEAVLAEELKVDEGMVVMTRAQTRR